MKYDILHELRSYLNGKHGKNTANKYYFAVKSLLRDLDFDRPEQIEPEEVQQLMKKLKTKNDFSAAKCGLLEFQSCFPALRLPDDGFFSETSKHKRNFKKREFEPVKLDTIKRKINAIRNQRLKLAYRLMLASGARVFEVEALKPEDIIITGDTLQININDGKGGKSRTVDGIEDKYLAKELPKLIAATPDENNLFYSASYMRSEAANIGIECHDLRRAFAKTYLVKQKKEAPDAKTAYQNLMNAMGHVDRRTTKRYLKRKIEL